jgi:hypothetical protein
MTRAILVAALLAVAATTALAQSPADLRYCNALAAQYDRYAWPRDLGPSPMQLQRVVGYELCRRGEVADGEKKLLQAVQALGLSPVPRPGN